MLCDTGCPLFSFAIIADTHITDEEAVEIVEGPLLALPMGPAGFIECGLPF